MDCKETLKNLSLLLDGELDSGKQEEVIAHFEDCWHCSETKENEQKLRELIRQKISYSKQVPAPLADSIRSLIFQKD